MMSQRKPISKIKKQIDALKEEQQEIKIFLERDKKKFSEELIKFKKEEIKNTIHEEENYTLWQRILRTLGMN
jgi:transcription antitermination factor NusA-like protein